MEKQTSAAAHETTSIYEQDLADHEVDPMTESHNVCFGTEGGTEIHVQRRNQTMRCVKHVRQSLAFVADESKTEEKKEKPAGGRVFVDTQAMKEKVRQNLIKPKYNVFDFYCTAGVWQFVARHQIFDYATLCIIAFNALWIALDTDGNTAEVLVEAHPIFQLAENFFCAYFSMEWLIRYKAFKRKRDGLKDAWFVFDSCMVGLMVAETWVLSIIIIASSESKSSESNASMGNASILRIARLMRLSRMARMARLLRAMPELMILIKGMLAACRSVFFTLCLLGLVMFVFGIAFTQLAKDYEISERYFSTVPESMYTLLVRGTLLDDVGNVVSECRRQWWFLAFTFFFYVLVATLTVMNMLIGVLCEVVSAVAATEREEMLVSYVGGRLRSVVELLDTDRGGTISKKEFLEILENVDAIKALQDVGVDVVGLVDFADFIFEIESNDDSDDLGIELSIGEFMDVVLQLRGSNTATVKDIVDLRKFIQTSFAERHVLLSSLHEDVKAARKTLSELANQSNAKTGITNGPANPEFRLDTPIATSGTTGVSFSAVEPSRMTSCVNHGDAIGSYATRALGVESGSSPTSPMLSSEMHVGLLPEMSDVSVASIGLRGRWFPFELPTLQVENVGLIEQDEPPPYLAVLSPRNCMGKEITSLDRQRYREDPQHPSEGFNDRYDVLLDALAPARAQVHIPTVQMPRQNGDSDVNCGEDDTLRSTWTSAESSAKQHGGLSHKVSPLVKLCAEAASSAGIGARDFSALENCCCDEGTVVTVASPTLGDHGRGAERCCAGSLAKAGGARDGSFGL
eukprot:TRINITY_DN8487_c0_g2_i1.p1 TRINITY_DN8487_c0_g2~~TRINITY_DN8487_c0_g2_i1.p1  ORF type:complete len:801 (+),score=117.49 TRINITY_DN8487_c0_g2_i1:225-2627(+)